MLRPRVIVILLAVVTLLTYLPVWRCDFIDYDDDDYVTNNSMVKAGLTTAGVKWAFTKVYAENWHPVTWLSHMADCQFFGLNPHAQHLVNALFHAVNVALLFLLLFRLTSSTGAAVLVAALFAWHPLHVESVAWIAERKDVLSTFFALLALLSYARYARENRRSHYWCAVAFFAVGLMAKPMLVTLPFVMLLLDFWPLRRVSMGTSGGAAVKAAAGPATKSAAQLVFEKWPFLLLAVASCVVTMVAQSQNFRAGAAMVSLESYPLSERLKAIPVAYVAYLLKTFWPVNLAVFYPLAKSTSAALAGGAFLVLAAISAFAWWKRRASPYILVGWLWFLGTLVPVIGLVQVGNAAMADRYMYLPSIGIFIIIVFALGTIPARRASARWPMAAAGAVVLVACLSLMERQLQFWRSSETLFRHALAVTPDNDISRICLGHYLDRQGRLKEALDQYRAAAGLNPARALTHNNLANVLDLLGRPAESLAEYRLNIQLVPNDASQHTGAGYELGVMGQYDEALKEFAIAEQLAPRYAAPHMQAAQVYIKMGRDADGLKEFQAALALAPDNWHILTEVAHYLAANENAALRDGRGAMKLAAKANILTGGSVPSVCDVLGMACAETGDFADAIDSVQHAIELATAAHANTEPFQRRLELYRQHQPWHESFRISSGAAGTNVLKGP